MNVYDDVCGTTIFGCLNTDDSGPVDVTGLLDAETTYTVMIGTGDNIGGEADLCIDVTTGCVNDECDFAIVLDDGVLLSTQTNSCTEDPTIIACGDLQQATSWYSFTIPVGSGFNGADITNVIVLVYLSLDVLKKVLYIPSKLEH